VQHLRRPGRNQQLGGLGIRPAPPAPHPRQPVTQIAITYEIAAALRDLQLPDSDCERPVFAIRADDNHATLAAAGNDLDELIGFVAAEANHEPSRSRRQRLDAAFDALSTAAQTPGRW
jgi:hypothetical protein